MKLLNWPYYQTQYLHTKNAPVEIGKNLKFIKKHKDHEEPE